MNGWRNYPFTRVPGDLEVDLPDGTGDGRYLDELGRALPQALRRSRPGSVSCSPGPTRTWTTASGGCPSPSVGSSSATSSSATRSPRRASACVTLAGGYAEDIRDTVEINVNTLRVFTRFPGMPPPPP